MSLPLSISKRTCSPGPFGGIFFRHLIAVHYSRDAIGHTPGTQSDVKTPCLVAKLIQCITETGMRHSDMVDGIPPHPPPQKNCGKSFCR